VSDPDLFDLQFEQEQAQERQMRNQRLLDGLGRNMDSAVVRLHSRIKRDPETGCWLWTGPIPVGSKGYARLRVDGKRWLAHRFSYHIHVGPIPHGMTIDHLCRVRHCINPRHMEPVSTRTNVLRGVGTSAVNARKTHCVHGHPFDEENTKWVKHRPGRRECRTCQREYFRRARAAGKR